MDDESEYLTTSSSDCSLYADSKREKMILHYDYKRNPDNPYPAAHFQVHGVSERLQYLCGIPDVGKQLERYHFPVGGRRFRPSFEDVVEFLIVEDLAVAHDGWQKCLNQHRKKWERQQLAAAIRRDPSTARATLEALGGLISE